MKKHFKKLIVITFSLILTISVGCSNSKVTNNKDMDVASKKVINEVISNYISNYYSHILTNAAKVFEAHKVYAIEQKDGLANVYIYTLFEGYIFSNGKFSSSSSGTNPAFIVLKKDKGKFNVVKFQQPKDGTECEASIKKMFPRKYAKEAMSDAGRDLELEKQIKLKAKEWLKAQGGYSMLEKNKKK
ncbi:hypothetical protein ACJDU8_06280 [Clostridium sp. WILCCON 0269]|uniref:DUF4468 domain-containing protein n=1 Tax=Candidatus Clostridium eludens TaxID=3381663 RepID=A0ABW8SIV5_9CLOT